MQPRSPRSRLADLILGLALGTLPVLPLAAQDVAPAVDARAPAMDLRGADLRAFIQDVAVATGTSFIVDPSVQGTVEYTSDHAPEGEELLGVLLAILRGNGLIAVPAGPATYRVIPDDAGAQHPRSAGGAGFGTTVIPLARIDARVAAETLKPLVGRGGVVLASPQGNSLLVADYSDNLARIRQLVAQIDSDRATIDTVTLRNSSAREVAATVRGLFGVGGEGGGQVLSILPVEGSNSVVVRGDPTVIARVIQMILELDRRAERSGNVRVIELRHASAEQLLPVLQELVGQSGQDPAGTTTVPGEEGAQVIGAGTGRRPTIVRAPGRNALIVNADPDVQRTLVDVINQLDSRREQVLVEAIVVELSDDAARELGVQIAAAGRDGDVPFMATQFRGNGPGITELAGAALVDGEDDSDLARMARNAAAQSLLGLSGGLAGIAGEAGDLLFGVIINAVRSNTGSNLLSTPSILTLDNEPARILVGQEIPVTSGEVLGDSNTNPFRTIDRQDVGIQLEVTPQINAGGGITLELRQEVSSIAGPVAADFSELILNKREIETRVLVDDGAIVVLGGLLDQQDRRSTDKVPVLGDIPGLGRLFRSDASSSERTNLMVFLRPTIIRDAGDAQRMTAPRYEYMRGAQLQLHEDVGRNSRHMASPCPHDPTAYCAASPGPAHPEAALDALVRDYLRTTPPQAPAQ